MRGRRWLWVLVGLAVLLAVAGTGLATFYTDFLWFKQVGYLSIFIRILTARASVGIAGTLLFFLITYLNLKTVLWRRPSVNLVGGLVMPVPLSLPRRTGRYVFLVSAIVGLLGGLAAYSQWHVILAFFNRTPFEILDPFFGKDAGFYIFSLPFIRLIHQHLWVAMSAATLVSGFAYFIFGELRFAPRRLVIDGRARTHLSILAVSLFLLKAWGYQINVWDLMYSPRGVAFGASYTDIHAQVPAFRLLMLVAVIGALVSLFGLFVRNVKWVGYSVAGLIVLSLAVGYAYPSFMQQFTVSPNELAYELPFIEHNINFTRRAFNLDSITATQFAATEDLTLADIRADTDTIRNVRLWDYRVLKDTYTQVQEIRMYYKFNDVDVDRYTIDGEYKQVMLSPRELDIGSLPPEANTWINLHLKYTHGYGLVMSPVSQVTGAFYFSDVPPKTSTDLRLERPEIYFGELTNQYIIVNTKEPEFNYPRGEGGDLEPTFYRGQAGIGLGNIFTRLAFMLRFTDYQIMVSGAITPDSRLIMKRNIIERVSAIAPFFMYDRDPYLVVADGRLVWIIDGYTVSANYPYSQPEMQSRLNYIRNSVKVVVDAYDGDITFYQADNEDPIIRTYAKIFPDLMKPMSSMPPEIASHIRMPEDLFKIQTRVLLTYHMTDPNVYYNKEDYWELPMEIYGQSEQAVEPYYVVLTLPGQTEPEYLLVTSFTPRGKPNMTAWLGARCDPAHYGQMILFVLPKDKLIPGPMQVESLIAQEPQIAQNMTLWGQVGSQVIRGNLLSIPIRDSLLYIEPLYIQAERVKIPELKRVLMYYGGRVVMGTTVDDALNQLFGAEVSGAPGELDKSVQTLTADAVRLWEDAQERLKTGDWAGYGKAVDELGRVLVDLEKAAAVPELTPEP